MSESEFLFAVVLALVMLAFVVVLIGAAWLVAKTANITAKMKSAGSTTRPQAFQNPTVRPALERIRDELGGRLLPGVMYELPRLTFDHQGVPVLVEANFYLQSTPTSPAFSMSVRLVWPDGAFRMEVYPDDLLAQLKKLFGMRDIEVGEAAFDRKYMISGSDAHQVRNFLSPQVRELIGQIRGPSYADHVHLRIVGGHLWITKRTMSGDYASIQRLIELSLALYEAALAQPLAGIEFLDELIFHPDAAICQVCGEGIAQLEVQCTRCRTPHHRECWHYLGGCSIYGCRGKECEPQLATRISKVIEQERTKATE